MRFISTGLVKGIDDFYSNEFGFLSHELFDTMGFNSFSKIRDYNKCCNYITKYITKDCVKNDAGTVYISSRGLKKASRYQISDPRYRLSIRKRFRSNQRLQYRENGYVFPTFLIDNYAGKFLYISLCAKL